MALLLFFFGLALLGRPSAAATFQWEYTGSLNHARMNQQAALLIDGRVLVAGGTHDGYLASAELYEPATGNWTSTGDLNLGRTAHTATVVPNGKVLVVAGVFGPLRSDYTATTELYDPATGSWAFTGSLNNARYSHTATLLAEGRVLVAGGLALSGSLASAETLRSSDRKLDRHQQPPHCSILRHGDVAGRRPGARRRWL